MLGSTPSSGSNSGYAPRNRLDDTRGDTSRDPVEELATEFAERYRAGDEVSVEEYAARFPEHADEIRDLFPTIAAMERLTTKRRMDSAMMDQSKPQQLGDYRIIDEIARGGMGIVYEAEQISLGRRVAVKVLPTHALSRQKDILRFQREAQTAASLHHTNIVPVFGAGSDKGHHYIVMQYIRGVGLDEILNEIRRVFVDEPSNESATPRSRLNAIVRSAANLVDSQIHIRSTKSGISVDTEVENSQNRPGGKLPPNRAIRLRSTLGAGYFRNVANIGFQVAKALQYAHERDTLHRDIKPGNLILDEDGRVWIADFGLAKAIQDENVTRSDDVVGTIAYVAPERFHGSTTRSSDIYSLGVTLYEMLTLQKAFGCADRIEVLRQATSNGLPQPRSINDSVPIDLETIVMKAAASEPRDRYKSAAALARDLEAYMEDRPIEARRISYLEHGVRWCRRNRLLTGMSIGVVLLIAMVMGLLAFGYRHSVNQRLEAEQTTANAIDLIEGIYNHFAITPFKGVTVDGSPLEGTDVHSLVQPSGYEPTPISRDTAVMLQNLLSFYDELAKKSSDSTAVAMKAISATRRVGDIHVLLEQLSVARASYEKALQRIEQLPDELRGSTAMRVETARIYNGMGLSYYRDYLLESHLHLDKHQAAVDVLDIDSKSPHERFELATSLYLLHHSAEAAKERAEQLRNTRKRRTTQPDLADFDGLGLLQRAKKILIELKEDYPEQPEYEHALARCLLPLHPWKQSYSEPDQKQALVILHKLVEEYPENPEYQHELGQAYLAGYGRFRWLFEDVPKDHQLEEAIEELRSILELTVNLEVHHPNIPKYYKLKKHIHESLGYLLFEKRDLFEARQHYDRAVKFQRLLIAHAELPEEHIPWLHRLETDFSKGLIASHQLEEAKAKLANSAVEFERFFETSGDELTGESRLRARAWLQEIYSVMAKLEKRLGNSKGYEELMEKSVQTVL